MCDRLLFGKMGSGFNWPYTSQFTGREPCYPLLVNRVQGFLDDVNSCFISHILRYWIKLSCTSLQWIISIENVPLLSVIQQSYKMGLWLLCKYSLWMETKSHAPWERERVQGLEQNVFIQHRNLILTHRIPDPSQVQRHVQSYDVMEAIFPFVSVRNYTTQRQYWKSATSA